ncbi:MAG: hypothetical protein NTV43_07590 [Methylococcales bacterium]|nr:hypothetical protein [Methylococcales bacterium]
MKPIIPIAAAVCLAFSLGHPALASTDTNPPIEILDFMSQNGMTLQKATKIPVSKYPLAGKTVALSGKLSISGSASYMGHTFHFAAPGDKSAIWHASYTFGAVQADGSIPFKLNQLYGNFNGVMIPTAADKYKLIMNDKQGSMLSSLVYYASQSPDTWKSTSYTYTAVATQKKVKGVTTIYLEVKEKAGFRITIPGLKGAVANYTYSLDWKSAVN